MARCVNWDSVEEAGKRMKMRGRKRQEIMKERERTEEEDTMGEWRFIRQRWIKGQKRIGRRRERGLEGVKRWIKSRQSKSSGRREQGKRMQQGWEGTGGGEYQREKKGGKGRMQQEKSQGKSAKGGRCVRRMLRQKERKRTSRWRGIGENRTKGLLQKCLTWKTLLLNLEAERERILSLSDDLTYRAKEVLERAVHAHNSVCTRDNKL